MKIPPKCSQLSKKILLSFVSFLVTVLILELFARIYMPFHAPVLLRDGIYVSVLPLVTGVAHSSFNSFYRRSRLREKKTVGEVRIFIYGESSVQGVPLDENSSAPTMLYDMLVKDNPARNIKVINMGRTASISANVYYYLLAARRYNPDFIIFYMGMNDDANMPGEQCWAVSHPELLQVWQWVMERSWLLWTMRVYGPAFLWSIKPGHKDQKWSNWSCPEDPFPKWTDMLVSTATSTGAKVIVTTPVQSVVTKVEPQCYSNTKNQRSCDSMTSHYRELLLCRLTEGCDFIPSLKNWITARNKREISKEKNKKSLLDEHNDLLNFKSGAWLKAAKRYGADFIDFRSALENSSPHRVLADFFFADEIHLKPEGYYYLASFWFEHIKAQLDGASIHQPHIPTYENIQNYYKSSKISGTSMSMNYLMRGWYLTAVPGLEMIVKHCPSGKCDELAIVAMGWLRKKVGLEPLVPKKLSEKVKRFDPAKWQY